MTGRQLEFSGEKRRGVRRALVLGSGGLAGIAWEIGVVAGLEQRGIQLRAADLYVGTSAGSVVAGWLTSSIPTAALFDRAVAVDADPLEEARPYSQSATDARARRLYDKFQGDLDSARRHMGAAGLRDVDTTTERRFAIIAHRVGRTAWPQQTLRIVVMEARTGLRHVFSERSGVTLIEATMASCAVPTVWPAVRIGNREYVDGGLVSMTNADLASDAETVVVLSPSGYGETNPLCGHLHSEVRELRDGGCRVCTVVPDAATLTAMGDNVLDPAVTPAVARAAFAQGQECAHAVAETWLAPLPGVGG